MKKKPTPGDRGLRINAPPGLGDAGGFAGLIPELLESAGGLGHMNAGRGTRNSAGQPKPLRRRDAETS